jgi:hypothetical protein
MNSTIATRIAWALWGACVAMLLLVLFFSFKSRHADSPLEEGAVGFLFALPMLAFPTVGAVVASRRPLHPVGWLFLAVGLLFAIGGLAPAYVEYDRYVNPGVLPAVEAFVWSISWIDAMVFLSIAFLLLLFPTGKLPSLRWRPVLWLAIVTSLIAFVTSAFKPGLIWPDTLRMENPLGIEALDGTLRAVDDLIWIAFVATIVLSGASIVARFRGSRGDERQQLKWIALAALLVVTGFLGVNTTSLVGPAGEAVLLGFFAAALAAIPITAGIAILRYRLYDIDRVISRTLVYLSLTVVLGASYFGLVLAGQALFSSFAGGSNLAIAASTLVVAALFLPVRSRVQGFVDRRFYRRRYDAQRTLEGFGARLREQVDLGTLESDVLGIVIETMQPTGASVWLRDGAR